MKILFTGDVKCNDSEQGRTDICDTELKQYVAKHDYVFCDFEGPIINSDCEKSDKRGPNIYNGNQVKDMLLNSGFNGALLANNHIMDYGVLGLKNTIDVLHDSFLFCGAGVGVEDIFSPIVLNDANVSVAVFSIGEKQFGACGEGDSIGFAWMMHSAFWEKLKKANNENDYVVVVCHCGAEEINVPLPEVKRLYRLFIDYGADIVVGQHTHVIQGSEEYKGKKIYYSLGNFAFDNEDGSPYNPIGAILSIDVDRTSVKCEIKEVEYKDGLVDLLPHDEDYCHANQILHSNQYEQIIQRYCEDTFKNYFSVYIAASIGLHYENSDLLDKFVEHRKNNEELTMDYLFVYHNMIIETNRWITEHAVKGKVNNL